MANEALVSLTGFVATQPKKGQTKRGTLTVSMRVGWTPRTVDRATDTWSDLPSSFLTVRCYRKLAEHAGLCLRRGDPIVVRGTLRIREYTDQSGQRRSSVEVDANSIGHDMWRGISTLTKLAARNEMTAEEYERSLAEAASRSPLPGDLDQAEPSGEPEPGRDAYEDDELAGEDPADLGDEPEPTLALAGDAEHHVAFGDEELADADGFEQSSVREMADTDHTIGAIGAPAGRGKRTRG